MVLLDLSIYPIGKGESLSRYVARCIDVIDRSGLPYRCHAMGTEIEGEFDAVMAVVRQCFDALAADCHRISCSLKLDYRKDAHNRLDGKIASVEAKLGRPVQK